MGTCCVKDVRPVLEKGLQEAQQNMDLTMSRVRAVRQQMTDKKKELNGRKPNQIERHQFTQLIQELKQLEKAVKTHANFQRYCRGTLTSFSVMDSTSIYANIMKKVSKGVKKVAAGNSAKTQDIESAVDAHDEAQFEIESSIKALQEVGDTADTSDTTDIETELDAFLNNKDQLPHEQQNKEDEIERLPDFVIEDEHEHEHEHEHENGNVLHKDKSTTEKVPLLV